LTVGPWRPVYLHSYHTRISDLHTSALVNEGLDADLIVRIALSPSEAWTTAEVSLKDPASSESSIITSQSNINFNNSAAPRIVFHFEKGEVRLWYPVGYGEQPLYEVQVRIYDDVRSLLIGRKLITEVIGVARPIIG
jgi:beta-mannosidase